MQQHSCSFTISSTILNLFSGLALSVTFVSFTCIVSVCVLLYVGSMDEVNQEVNITWVQPRVLGLNQVCVISSFFLYEFGHRGL